MAALPPLDDTLLANLAAFVAQTPAAQYSGPLEMNDVDWNAFVARLTTNLDAAMSSGATNFQVNLGTLTSDQALSFSHRLVKIPGISVGHAIVSGAMGEPRAVLIINRGPLDLCLPNVTY